MDKEEGDLTVIINGSMTNNTHIADDLLIEIFSRLPIKSLFRFKCVSKTWCSLISNYSHQARVLSTLSGLFYEIRTLDEDGYLQRVEYSFACLSNQISRATSYVETTPINLSFLPFYPHFKIVDCCNGLLLCLTGKTKGTIFYVCNPLLKRWIALPNPQTKFRPPDARLVHHPTDSAHFRVFLHSSYSFRYGEPASVAFGVFDSATGKWEIQDAHFRPEGDDYLSLTQSPLVFNEALHYMCYPFRILKVSVKGGSCDVIHLPKKNRQIGGALLGYEGHLYYVCEDELQIWMLKDWEAEEWIKIHEICSKVLGGKILEAGGSLTGNRRTRRGYTRPLAFGPGLDFALITDQRKIFSCDLRTMKVEEIFSLGEDDDGTHRRFSFHPALYSPSLITLEEARPQLSALAWAGRLCLLAVVSVTEHFSGVVVTCSMTNIHITDDLVIQILSRLPIKSLFRFKCVSKAWCSLISDYSTQARVLSTLSGLFYEIRSLQRVEYNFACLSTENSGATSYIDTISISLSFLPFYPDFEIVDCCNGLLLCTTEGPVFYVCNPLLKRWIALPNPQTKCRYLEATLVRHPEDSAHFRVFFLTGCSYRFRGPNQIRFYVFDSAAGKGEIRDAFFDEYHLMFEQSPILINEALHYACAPLRIQRVNVNGWTCDAIDLPNTSRESKGTLLEFEGHLCYVCHHLDFYAGEDKLQIWMLKDWDTEGWVKMHEICNKVLVAKILEAGGSPIGKLRMLSEYTRPLAFGPGLGFALFTDQRNVFSCDLQSMKVEKIFSLGEDDFDGTYRRLRIHPALSSPSSNTLEEARQQLQSTK